jgi:hypothetical protein
VPFDDEAVPLQSLDGHATAYALLRVTARLLPETGRD